MNKDKISSGIGFILLGVIILLLNFKIIDWSVLSVLFVLWPLLFVVVGLNIIFAKYPLLKSAIWVVFVVVILYFTVNIDSYPSIKKSQLNYYVPITYEKVELKEFSVENLNVPEGQFQFEVGLAGDMSVHSGTTSDFVKVWAPMETTTMTQNVVGSLGKVYVKDMHTSSLSNDGFNYDVMLNPDVEWRLIFKTGIITGDFNLKDILIKELRLESGAGDMNIVIGRVTEDASIKVATGVSSLDMSIDPDIGVCIIQDTVFSNNFKEGWFKQDDKYYSNNYQSAKSKVTIHIESAISDINIEH